MELLYALIYAFPLKSTNIRAFIFSGICSPRKRRILGDWSYMPRSIDLLKTTKAMVAECAAAQGRLLARFSQGDCWKVPSTPNTMLATQSVTIRVLNTVWSWLLVITWQMVRMAVIARW